MAALWRLHLRTGKPIPVSRAELVQALRLPEATIDERLRVLVRLKKVMNVSRGLYSPVHQKGTGGFDRYWRHRPPPDWQPSPQDELDKVVQGVQPPGTRRVLKFPEGVVLIERWLSFADYARLESRRQQLKDLGVVDLDDEDDA